MMAACFTSIEEYNQLLNEVEILSENFSGGKESIGLTLSELMVECNTTKGKIQHILAVLGKKIKRTKHGTYFYLPNLDTVPKRKAKKLFYQQNVFYIIPWWLLPTITGCFFRYKWFDTRQDIS